jgi:hypothetical protein
MPDAASQVPGPFLQRDHVARRRDVCSRLYLVSLTMRFCRCASRHHARPLSAAVIVRPVTAALTCLILRRSELDLDNNKITSLAGATFAGDYIE